MWHMVLIVVLAVMANAAVASDCSKLKDDSARLACYDAARACLEIESSQARLRCYDGAFGVVAQDTVVESATPVPEPGRADDIAAREAKLANLEAELAEREAKLAQEEAAKKEESRDEFGKRWRDGDEPVDFIEARIVQLKSNPFKEDYMRLDNGQVWRENSDSGLRFKVGDEVVITEGVLGSFDLQVEGSSRFIKVKRVK